MAIAAGVDEIEVVVSASDTHNRKNVKRSTDESVPQALSGYRPSVAVTASGGYQYTDVNGVQLGNAYHLSGTQVPRSVGITASQTLFNGNRTANRTRAAESQVSSAREGLRVLERTLAGYARHANLAGVLVVGLGCEANQVDVWLKRSHLSNGPLAVKPFTAGFGTDHGRHDFLAERRAVR